MKQPSRVQLIAVAGLLALCAGVLLPSAAFADEGPNPPALPAEEPAPASSAGAGSISDGSGTLTGASLSGTNNFDDNALPVTASEEESESPADPTPTDMTNAAESSNDETYEAEVVSIEESPESDEDAASDSDGTVATDINELGPSVELGVEALPTEETPILEEGEAEIAGETDNYGPNPEDVAATIVEEEPVAGQPEHLASIEIAVVDESGDPLPLASEAAAEILASGDPIWCPVSVAVPKPNTGGCTASFTSLADLFAELTAHPKNVDGTIWIEKDYSSGLDATLDGGNINLATMRNFKLTLKGGWNGCGVNPPATCVGSIDTLNPSEITHQVNILAWNNDLTLSDLLISEVTSAAPALVIETTGKITLTRVEVSDNNGSGASLDNTAGTKDVSINISTFNNNEGGDGLNIASNGLVTLKDVEATHNGADGAFINNVSLTLKNVTLLGTNVFSENLGHGLEIRSSGQINLSNLVNNVNGNYGLWIDNSSSTKAVIISGANEFKFNGGGVKILSNGAITINNITATNNSVFEGALIDNSGGLAANVVLTGTNVLSFNQLDGLHILSKGAITLNKTTASGNGLGGVNGYGAWLDNSGATSARAIVINTGTFSDNFEGGLLATSNGAITISKLVTNGNEGKGAELNNLSAGPLAPQNITLTGSVSANLNKEAGLDIQTLGAVNLASVSANGNQSVGVLIVAGKSVSLSGTSSFNENHAVGISITNKGAITLNNVTANSNWGQGALLDNDEVNASGNLTVSGINEFSGNHLTGLEIYSRGSVLIANVHAIGNWAKGISIDNSVTGFQGSVTIGTSLVNWCNDLSQNKGTGLSISSFGAVTLTNVCSSKNGDAFNPGFGAEIDNGSASLKPVVLKGVNSFNENYSGGIFISSSGAIAISNLTAFNNLHGFGAALDNAANVNKPASVTLTGFNSVTANYGNGLTVTTYGAVLINNLTASSNGANGGSGYGAWLDNCNEAEGDCTTATPQSITLTGRNSFSSNVGNGLKILSLGAIKVNNVGATSNSGTGAILNNDFDGAVGGVSITGTLNVFSINANGLEATSRRAISISNLEASSNDGYGATLSNYANPPSPQNITISGYAIFDDNEGAYGLSVRTWGAINVSNLSASNNGAQGAILDNAEGPGATGAITLAGIQKLLDNNGSGLEITSNRAVAISNLNASLNNGFGASIANTAAGLLYDVKLTGSNAFSENDLIGLDIHTYGAITLNNITANQNGLDALDDLGYGVYLDNRTGATLAKPVTLTGISTFNENFEDGLFVQSSGQIKANSLSAVGNTGNGVNLDNQSGTLGIALTGVNNFQGNTGFGLPTFSRGSISLVNLTANLNLSGGAKVENSGSGIAAAVSITGTNTFNANGTIDVEGAGLLVKSRGDIKLSNLTADANLFVGVQLDNQTSAIGTPSISLAGINSFSGNRSTGLFIQAGGDVNLARLVADGNIGDGLFVASIKNVNFSCVSLTANEGAGMVYAVSGNVTLKGVYAYGNHPNASVSAMATTIVRGCPLP